MAKTPLAQRFLLALLAVGLLNCANHLAGGSTGTDNPSIVAATTGDGTAELGGDTLWVRAWRADHNPFSTEPPLWEERVVGGQWIPNWQALDTVPWTLELRTADAGAVITGLNWENGQLMRNGIALDTDTLRIALQPYPTTSVYVRLDATPPTTPTNPDEFQTPVTGTPIATDSSPPQPTRDTSVIISQPIPSDTIIGSRGHRAYIAGTSYTTTLWVDTYPVFTGLPPGNYRVEVLDDHGALFYYLWIRVEEAPVATTSF